MKLSPKNFKNKGFSGYTCIHYKFTLKTIAVMTSQTQNFLIFWLLILDSKSFQIIFKKMGVTGH